MATKMVLVALAAVAAAIALRSRRRPPVDADDMRPAEMWPDLVDRGMAGAAMKILTR